MRDNLDRQQQPITDFQRQLVNENTVRCWMAIWLVLLLASQFQGVLQNITDTFKLLDMLLKSEINTDNSYYVFN